jgi:hypothetical protein
MIRLTNGATVHAAFILPASPGMKPHGLVLAETENDFVTWEIYWDGETTGDERGQTHELWECETGPLLPTGHAPNPRQPSPHGRVRLRAST